jgi:hypothetical protein
MMSEEKEIQQVMAEEKRRGSRRKPLDTVTAQQQARIRAKFLRAIQEYNEADFIVAIAELGHAPGSAEYERLMKLWRERGRPSRP